MQGYNEKAASRLILSFKACAGLRILLHDTLTDIQIRKPSLRQRRVGATNDHHDRFGERIRLS